MEWNFIATVNRGFKARTGQNGGVLIVRGSDVLCI